ncbi:response regulator transcription factor [Clostridium oceanicum]|uniref:Stage 0 sporulation protein A homolog n=1 Tax=Clostridium oceanicum TaxID=1543 RepID=A0ABN1JDW7_9CLOT
MPKEKILVVEDEFSINDILTTSLLKEGYEVKSVFNGRDALNIVEEFNPDLVLLDLMLPDIDGFDICKRIYQKYQVIMITARDDIVDKLLGLELGADDYITKPFDIREVKARIKVLFRRPKIRRDEEESYIDLTKAVKFNPKSREILKNDKIVDLKRKEFELFLYLYRNRNIVLSRENILEKVWGYEYLGDTRTVDVHIRRIRSKIDIKEGPSIIETVFGVGYVMR